MFTRRQSGRLDWPWRSGAWAAVPLLVALCLALFPGRALAQDEEKNDAPPSAAEIAQIKAKSAQLLEVVAPAPKGLFAKAGRPLKTLEMAGGTVHWGNLFGAKEILALTNLAPPTPPENDWDHPPQYLCLFAWVKGHWIFRQFLGDAYDLEFHEHQGTYFLQGDYREGRYGGEHLSWWYDADSKKLVRTHFEDWGPFYLAGDYLICKRGFERRAHDTSYVIYRYKNRRKGAFAARVHENDSGRSDLTFRNPRTRKLETWAFFSPFDSPEISVTVTESKEKEATEMEPGEEGAFPKTAHWSEGGGGWAADQNCLQLLTGLNAHLLDDQWMDQLPTAAPLPYPYINATGDPDLVARLKGTKPRP